MVDIKRIDWLTIVTTIAPIILGGSVVTSLITVVLSDMNKPDVKIDVIPDLVDERNVSVQIHNTGRSPATNLKVSVNAPENITHHQAFTTDDINLTKVEQTRLLLNANKLIQGDGSLISLNLQIDGKPNIDYSNNYSVFAVFDQGSSKGVLPRTEFGIFYDFLVGSIIDRPFLSIIVISIITVISIIILKRRLKNRRNKHALNWTTQYLRQLYEEFVIRQHEEGAKSEILRKEYLETLENELRVAEDARSRGRLTHDTYDKINKLITDYKNKNL